MNGSDVVWTKDAGGGLQGKKSGHCECPDHATHCIVWVI